MPKMLVFLDECLPERAFRTTLEARGHAGRVLFNCPHPVAIEREYDIAEAMGIRLIMRITAGNFRVER